ncbi:MAG: cell division ATP-binding protein FtsE [Hyphomonadaceae bacterium]
MAHEGYIVRFEGVWAGYDGPDVLEELDFDVTPGEVAIVSGPTAAGKTSLLHMLRLALPPRAGEAHVLGEDIARMPEKRRAKLKRRIGYIAEEPVFVEDWTTFENIALPLKMAGRKPAEYAEDVRELLAFVGMSDAEQELTRRLSFAERRRIAIARALAGKPDLILADEPAAGQSPENAQRTFRLLAEIRRVGASVVIATQSEHLAEGIEATHWHIRQGRIARAGETPFSEMEHFS